MWYVSNFVFLKNIVLEQTNLKAELFPVLLRHAKTHLVSHTLREKCPNTEFFLVRVSPYSEWIWKDTEYLSVFSPNAEKHRLEKTLFMQW